jgi:hypothetical protein
MPTLRVLADGRWLYATPGQPDLNDLPTFLTGGSDVVLCGIDYTAWLGAAAISASAWSVDGGTIGSGSTSGDVVSVLLTMPAVVFPVIPDPAYPQPVTLRNTLTASDGRVIHITMRLLAQPR